MGSDAKAIVLRTGAAFSSRADALIALSVLQALFSEQKAPITGNRLFTTQILLTLLLNLKEYGAKAFQAIGLKSGL